ncbi:MAG: ABC transporter permease [Shewanella sp.]
MNVMLITKESLTLSLMSLKVFLAHYRHKPLQAGSILLGIILAVTLLIGVKATNENAVRSYSEATELLSRQATAYILPPSSTGTLDESQYFVLRQAGLPVLAVLDGQVLDDQGQRWQINGSDIIAATALLRSAKASPQGSSASANSHIDKQQDAMPDLPLGRLLQGQMLAIVSQSLADRLTAKGVNQPSDSAAGSQATNKTSNNSASLVLAGQTISLQPLPDSAGLGHNILLDIGVAQQLLNLPGRLSYIAVMTDDPIMLAQVERLLRAGNSLKMGDQGEALTELTASFHLNLQAMAMLAFVVGLFIAYNGIRYSLMKRQRLLLKLLQAGVTRHALMLALLLELLLLVLVGASLGFVLGLQLSQWLQPMVAMTLEQLYGARLLPGYWQLAWLGEAIALTLAAAILACIPLYRALTTQSLARAGTQYTQSLIQYRSHKLQFITACILMSGAAALIPFSTDYRYSLALLGVLTLAMPLLLPQLMLWLVNLLEKFAPKGLVQYLLAETRELTAPLALAMMALILALSANVSMNTLVGSFEQTLKTWMDNRLHADLYIRPNPDDTDRIEQWLRQTKGINRVSIQWEGFSHISLSHQSDIQGDIQSEGSLTQNGAALALPRHRVMLLARDDEAMLATVSIKAESATHWEELLQGQSLMLSEPLALRHNIKVGDRLQLGATEHLFPEGLTVSAIYYDYGKPLGEVMISEGLWQKAGLSNKQRNFAVNWQGDIEQLQLQLQQQGIASAMMYSQGKIKTEAIKLFKRTFSITVVLNSLTLIVAAIGLFSASMMLMQNRQAPLARLYALGVPRPQLFAMVSIQMLLMVLMTCLLALPAGAILGWLLIHKVTLQAFGWSIVMVWDWWAYVQVSLLALLACATAVAIPLIRQTRRPLISSLQQEVL